MNTETPTEVTAGALVAEAPSALATEAPRPTPYLTIRASAGWRALDLRQIWRFRDLLVALGQRDLKLRYKQTAMGAIWVVLQPLMAAGIFAFVFGKVAKFPSDGVPYFLFAYVGMLGWTVFQGTITKSSVCLVGNANLVSKVFFPRLVLPLSTLFSTLVDFAVACVFMIILMACYHVAPTVNLLLFPVVLVLLVGLALGLGLVAAALTVSFRDVQYILPVATQFVMYASPVAYSAANVPEQYQRYFFLNPLAGIMESLRWSLLGQGTLPLAWLGYSAAWVAIVMLAGAIIFKSMEKQFADVI